MNTIVLNENSFKNRIEEIYLEEKRNILEERWNKLSSEEKKFVLETYRNLYPSKKHFINESTWLNTAADIVGIFDPTGIVDAINAASYFYQGDYFFGLLSMVSVIPYVGDTVAKPLMGIGKASKLTKGVDDALKLIAAGDKVGGAKILEKAARSNSLMNKFVKTAGNWAESLKTFVDRLPVGGLGRKLTSGVRNMIKDWCDVFIGLSKQRSVFKAKAAKIAAEIPSNPANAQKLVSEFNKLIKNDKSWATKFSSFTGQYKNVRTAGTKFLKPWSAGWMSKYFWPGATVGLLWRNRDLTSLVRRTKWYSGYLFYLADLFPNLVFPSNTTPDEIAKLIGDDKLNQTTKEYAQTPEAEKLWDSEFSNLDVSEPQQSFTSKSSRDVPPPPSSSSSAGGGDIIDNLIDAILS
jgi:hypothetical protein